MVIIRGNLVRTSTNNACSGIFLGQNNNGNWDSVSVSKVTSGFSMGDYTTMDIHEAVYLGTSHIFHATNDNDVKDNYSKFHMR